MASEQLEVIMNQVQQLSDEERLQLIKRVAEGLAESKKAGEPRYLIYGEYRNAPGRESTEEDFKLAEWNPTEEWLNGE
jgi:hypothetical protein